MNFALSGMPRRVIAGLVISLSLFVGGAALSYSATAAPAKAAGTAITLRHSSAGKVLVGQARKLVYVHVTASGKDVSCGPVCEHVWPLVKTSGKPHAGSGVKARKLGQTGTHQVTYSGHRLYYYAFSPQSITGNGAESFGGTWKVVSAKGRLR